MATYQKFLGQFQFFSFLSTKYCFGSKSKCSTTLEYPSSLSLVLLLIIYLFFLYFSQSEVKFLEVPPLNPVRFHVFFSVTDLVTKLLPALIESINQINADFSSANFKESPRSKYWLANTGGSSHVFYSG